MEIASGIKTEFVTDWVSSKDSRFALSRTYKSSGYDSRAFANREYGIGWSGNWSYVRIYKVSWGKSYVYGPGAQRIGFDGVTSDGDYVPLRSDLPYTLKRNQTVDPIEFVLTDGSGMQMVFVQAENFSSPYKRFVREIRWPDGYAIEFQRDAEGRVLSAEDNRNQRAEYDWALSDPANEYRDVISSVEVDPDYDGLTFDPDINVAYSYDENLGDPFGKILTRVEVTETSTGNTLSDFTYLYRDLGNSIGAPFLEHILDGRQDQSGQPFNYATFTPANEYNADLQSFRAISTEHAGATDRFLIETTAGSAPAGNVKVTNPLGRETEYAFDWVGGTTRPTQIDGIANGTCLATTKSLGYTPNAGAPEGYVYERIERNGAKTTFERDTRGLVTKKTEDADGTSPRVTDYTWDATYRLPLTRTSIELEETFTYDAGGLLTSYVQKDVLSGSPSLNQTRTWTYGYTTLASGLKVMTTLDGPGVAPGVVDVTTYAYNPDGTLQSMTDPNGLVTSYSNYDDYGNATRVVLPDGVAWQLTYDARGLITKSVENFDAGPENKMDFVYDIVGQLTSTTDGLGRITTYTYDEARRLTEITNSQNQTMHFTHDVMGNVTKTEYKDSSGNVEFFEDAAFDALGRLMTATGALGQDTNLRYDEEDNLITITDPNNRTRTNSYDALNRVYEFVNRRNQTTSLEHNEADQVTRYTDTRNDVTEFIYNGFGEVIEEDNQLRGTLTYTYNERGLVASMTDGRGIVSTFEYDDGGRITGRLFPSDSAEDQNYTYDFAGGSGTGLGKIRAITNDAGKLFRSYASDGYLSQERRVIDDLDYRTKLDFDRYGRLLWIQTPGLLRLRYTYDDDGRIRKITAQRRVLDPQTGQYPPAETVIDQVAYKPFGPPVSITYGDEAILAQSYDQSYRLTRQLDVHGSTPLRDKSYSWTDRDNLATATDALDSINSETFDYNKIEWLTEAAGSYGQINLTYINNSNRRKYIVDDGNQALEDFYKYTINRLHTIDLGAGGSRSLSYDGSGNITSDSNGPDFTRIYAYNAANRLESLSDVVGVKAEYAYNPLGQQIKRVLAFTGKTLHVIHDPDGNRIAEYDYDPVTATSTLLREYIWFDGLPVGVVEDNVIYFVRSDYIGRPVFATDGSGTKVWEVSYLPFGGVHTSTGTPMELRFPGQWFQSESGLHQNWMRDYDPTTGRYLQADPLGILDDPNVYGYARQNPGRYVDPRGEAVWLVPVAVGAATGVVLGWVLDDDGCYEWNEAARDAALGAAFGVWGKAGYAGRYGRELSGLTRSGGRWRVAPWGNRTNHPFGKWPHYHRSRPNPNKPGESLPGHSIRRHRPFEKKPSDKTILDRF